MDWNIQYESKSIFLKPAILCILLCSKRLTWGEWKCSCESNYLNSQSLWRDGKMVTDPLPSLPHTPPELGFARASSGECDKGRCSFSTGTIRPPCGEPQTCLSWTQTEQEGTWAIPADVLPVCSLPRGEQVHSKPCGLCSTTATYAELELLQAEPASQCT